MQMARLMTGKTGIYCDKKVSDNKNPGMQRLAGKGLYLLTHRKSNKYPQKVLHFKINI